MNKATGNKEVDVLTEEDKGDKSVTDFHFDALIVCRYLLVLLHWQTRSVSFFLCLGSSSKHRTHSALLSSPSLFTPCI